MSLSDIYQDGCVSADGTQLLTAAHRAVDAMHVRISPWGDQAWRNALTDQPLLNSRLLSETRLVVSDYPLCFDPRDGSVLVHHKDDPGRLQRYTRAGQPIGDPIFVTAPTDAPSEGIHHIEPADGRIVMGNDPSLTRRMPNGETWAGVVESQNFVCGGWGPPNDPRYGGSLSLLDKRTGVVTRWLGNTQVAHRLVEFPDGTPNVFISGIVNPPAYDAVPWALEFPPIPKPTLTPLPDGDFPSCWVGIQSDYGRGPGSCTWSPSPDPTDTRPLTETSAGAGTIIGRSYLHGLWLSDQNEPPQTVEAEIAFTKLKGAKALYVHQDDQSDTQRDNAANALLRVSGAGLHPLHALHVTGPFTPLTGFNALTMNLRTVGVDLNQLAANWAWFVNQLKLGLVEVAYLTNVFEREDKNDLSACWPELYAQVIELLGRIPTPRLKPGEVVPPVIEVPPPVVNPKPPRPPKPPHPEKPNYFGGWKKGL